MFTSTNKPHIHVDNQTVAYEHHRVDHSVQQRRKTGRNSTEQQHRGHLTRLAARQGPPRCLRLPPGPLRGAIPMTSRGGAGLFLNSKSDLGDPSHRPRALPNCPHAIPQSAHYSRHDPQPWAVCGTLHTHCHCPSHCPRCPPRLCVRTGWTVRAVHTSYPVYRNNPELAELLSSCCLLD